MSGRIIEKKITTSSHKNYKVLVENYNSAREVADDCKRRPITDIRYHDYDKERLEKWHGVKTYDEALNLLSNGYQPTVDKMRDAMKATVASELKRISFQNDIVGFAPIVPLAMMGVPNNMLNTRMKPIKAKVIDVYYDMTCSAKTKPEEIIRAGQALLGAIVELENQGYRFNLYGVQSYSEKDSADILTVKIKSSNQPMDLKRISFPLTHTAFFRVIGFDWHGRCPKTKYRDGYGRATYFEFYGDELNEFGKAVFGNNSVYLSATKILMHGDARKEYFEEVFTNANFKNED